MSQENRSCRNRGGSEVSGHQRTKKRWPVPYSQHFPAAVVVKGTALGKACLFHVSPIISGETEDALGCNCASDEIIRLEAGIKDVEADLRTAIEILHRDGYGEEAGIVEAHIMILLDLRLSRTMRDHIQENNVSAEKAVEHVIKEAIDLLKSSGALMLTDRAVDLRDIGVRLTNRLRKRVLENYYDAIKQVESPIVFTHEPTPSLLLESARLGIRGIVVERMSKLSHAAILARSFSIPVFRVDSIPALELRNHNSVLLDAAHGCIVVNPTLHERQLHEKESRTTVSIDRSRETSPIKLQLSITGPEQVNPHVLAGIDGIGLYRTEFLFINNREDFPDENEQYNVYRSVFEKAGDSTVTFRTLDIGGDKMPPYLLLGFQENPYLGLRAHRIYRFRPELFTTQIRAVLRAAEGHRGLRLMFPMVETTDELLYLQEMVKETMTSLSNEGVSYQSEFLQGIMVEVPSAIWNLEAILKRTDFCSIGTNDLFQYFFAVDRDNTNVLANYDPASPAAICMLRHAMDTARKMAKPIGMCGELAAEPTYLPVIVGLGFDSISVSAGALPEVSCILSRLDAQKCRDLVERCVTHDTAAECRKQIQSFCRVNGYEFCTPLPKS